MKKSFIVIFLSLIILIGLFIFLRPPQEIKLPTESNDSSQKIPPGVSGIKRFSDAKKNIAPTTGTDKSGGGGSGGSGRNVVPEATAKPLPYPRISLNYSIQTTNSIRGNSAGNGTFVIVALDIRNYGYRYFDAYPNNFRGLIRGDQITPLINVSTGNTIDAVIPNNSRAKGDLVFLIDNSKWMTGITFSPVNKSTNYYILYQELSPSEMGDQKVGVTHEED